MNDKLNNNVTIIPPFKRFCMTIGELPTSYTESMTYYESLVWLCNYIGKTLIPAINNNGEAVTELQEKYVELKDYVDNYFENLDVQTEINNKLDDMAESGELADIIAQYLQVASVLGFDTKAALKAAENLAEGSIARTLGTDTYNDGKGHYYKIRTVTSGDVIDDDNILALSEYPTLIAEKINDNIGKSIIEYDTKTDLKAATFLLDGYSVKTYGDTSLNDGFGYFYKIRTKSLDDIIDDLDIVGLTNFNDLVAERICDYIKGDKSNPIFYGADPTGTVDSSVAIQNCIDANTNKQVTFSCGTYLVNSPIQISYDNKYGGIDFNNSMIINTTSNGYVIGVGTKDHVLNHANSTNEDNRFYNITNLKMQSVSTYAILIDRWFMNTRFDNIDIITTKNCLQIGKLYDGYENKPSDVQLTNFIFTNTDMTGSYEAITVVGTDSVFSDGRIYGFKTGINANGNLIRIENIHFLACNFGETNLDTTYACIKDSGIVFADMCYCDSYPCFIKVGDNGQGSLHVSDLFIFSWHDQMTEAALFDFSDVSHDNYVPSININNVRFSKSSYPNDTQVVKLSTINAVNSNIVAGFNSFGQIRIAGVGELTNVKGDLSLAKNGYFSNNYNSTWAANWIPMCYLKVVRGGYTYVNVIDDSVGVVTFKLRFNADLSINTVEKISQSATGYAPALGIKNISTGLYEVCFAKNKNNLSTTTNVLDTIEVTRTNCCYVTPVISDLYNVNVTTLETVDTISS